MDNIIIRIIHMPPDVHGMTVVDADGNYNMYLNSRGDIESAFIHEIRHIVNGDFYSEEDIKCIEDK